MAFKTYKWVTYVFFVFLFLVWADARCTTPTYGPNLLSPLGSHSQHCDIVLIRTLLTHSSPPIMQAQWPPTCGHAGKPTHQNTVRTVLIHTPTH